MTVQLRPGQVAAAAGVNLETLRYYERRGLLERPERTLGGHRVYPSEAVTLLRIIKTAQRLGFSLTEVGDLLDVATHRQGQRRSSELQTRAKAKLAEVEQKITDLTAIRNTLRDAISGECVDLLRYHADVSTTDDRRGVPVRTNRPRNRHHHDMTGPRKR